MSLESQAVKTKDGPCLQIDFPEGHRWNITKLADGVCRFRILKYNPELGKHDGFRATSTPTTSDSLLRAVKALVPFIAPKQEEASK